MQLVIEDDPELKEELELVGSNGALKRQLSLSVVNRIKGLALDGVKQADIKRLVVISESDLEGILSEPLDTDQLERLGVNALLKEHETWLEYEAARAQVETGRDVEGKTLTADHITKFYAKYITKDKGLLVIPKRITYADVSLYRESTKVKLVENSESLVAGLRKSVLAGLYREAVSGALGRRDMISVLRVIGTGEGINGAKKEVTDKVGVQNNQIYNIQFNSNEIVGDDGLTMTKSGEVVGSNGSVLENISRQDLIGMIGKLDDA